MTPVDAPADTDLEDDIARLRDAYPETRRLYSEVCRLLFHKYGIPPTVTRLYQLVRKGSMSVPTEALGRFWRELRERDGQPMPLAGLPAPVQAAATEMVKMVWTQAAEQAHLGLAQRRAAVEAELAEVRAEAQSVRERSAQILEELARCTGALEAARTEVQRLGLDATRAQERLQACRGELATLGDVLRQEREAATCQREESAAALARAQDQLHRLQEHLDGARAQAQVQAERERQQVADARASFDRTCERLHTQLAAAGAESSLARASAAVLGERAATAESALVQLRRQFEERQRAPARAVRDRQHLRGLRR